MREWSNHKCLDHDDISCQCDSIVTVRPSGIQDQFIIRRSQDGIRRPNSQINTLICMELLMRYQMEGRKIHHALEPDIEVTHKFAVESTRSVSQIDIKPRIAGVSSQPSYQNKMRDVPKWVLLLAQHIDLWYHKKVTSMADRMRNNFFSSIDSVSNGLDGLSTSVQYGIKRVRLGKTYYNPPTLVDLCLQRISFYNTIAATWRGHRCVAYSLDFMDKKKSFILLNEFNVDTSARGPEFEIVRRLVPEAWRLFVVMNGLEKHKNSIVWAYNPVQIVKSLGSLMTSIGLTGGSRITTDFGITKNTGKKIEHIIPTVVTIHEFVVDAARGGRAKHIEGDCVIHTKDEMFSGWCCSEPKLKKLKYKCRLFFIPTFVAVVFARMFSMTRQKIERGRVRIGQVWWYGGAYELAQLLCYERDDVFWSTADVDKLDKNIRDWLLGLYASMMQYYMDYEKMSPGNRKVCERALEEMIYNLCVKVTCFPGFIWRIVVGVMYSGGYETSSGDTFVLIFAYAMYIAYSISKYPQYAQYWNECLGVGTLGIVAYGDDHMCVWPKLTRNILNHKQFSEFTSHFLGLTMRDVNEFNFFLAQVNHATGELMVDGPVFLKRRFIASPFFGTAPVLAWRSNHETVMKLLLNKDWTPTTMVLSCVGMAYDTYGANKLAYDLVREVYIFLQKLDPRTPLQIYNSMKDNLQYASYIKKYEMKLHMQAEEIFNHFPTHEHLLKRNRYIPARCSFITNSFEQDTYVWEE